MTTVDGCFACGNNARVDDLPPREAIHVDEHWRVAHAFNSALPGWLVVVSRQHVTALDEMPAAAAVSFGTLLQRLSAALRSVTGCTKVYVMFFAEAEGYEHLHVHLVPRMPDFEENVRGPKVFAFLGRPPDECVSADQMDVLASEVRSALSTSA